MASRGKELVPERVATKEGKPGPPTILGIGVGGGANIAMNLAKETLLWAVGTRHEEGEIADLERELREKQTNSKWSRWASAASRRCPT